MKAVATLDSLLFEAYAARASDIHLDPGLETFLARFRVDGMLYDARSIPPYLHLEILARLKILAGLRTDEHQAPQDGRFRFDITTEITIDVRISIAPTYYGENAVLRLLSSINKFLTLAALGCSSSQENIIRQVLMRPHGMILITGPTGSGKTSTLYALIQILNARSRSIITIEDPIEYALDGINQIPANPQTGLSFAAGLRSILRQDPDVIGIGEIRDEETASLAINASLTGHIVISTLHTTNAPTAIPRLMDMDIEPYLISSTVSLVIGQRLLRQLCPSCKVSRPLSKRQQTLLSRVSEFQYEKTEAYESAGCKKCLGTGVIGRTGIFELLTINNTFRQALTKKTSAVDLYSLACAEGMQPLLHDGLQKACSGFVSLDEVLALLTH